MDFFLRLFQVKLRPAPDHFDPVVDKILQQSVEVEHPGLVIDDRKVDCPETGLECGAACTG